MAPNEVDRDNAAKERYFPKRRPERHGIAICLSGGGYRATLFHLGALRRLNEFGILGKARTVTSVSGGSITAAHLATAVPWPLDGPLPDFETRVAAPLRAFTHRNIRTPAILQRLLPWNWFDSSAGVRGLAKSYGKLTHLGLKDLPDRPNFVLCATDMAFGVCWVFAKSRMGSYLPGYLSPVPTGWTLAHAVAASSCFPPVFNPLPVKENASAFKSGKADQKTRDAALRDLRLSDGGLYDNLGLEPVWTDHEVLLVSDGGGTFDYEADKSLFWRLSRYSSIMGNQACAIRKRWLISNYLSGTIDGAYLGISSARSRYDKNDSLGYSKSLATEVIAKIRTDLDAFSEAEACVLENHGYLLADMAVRKHVRSLLPQAVPALNIPHPEWMSDSNVRTALEGSRKRRIFGRW